MSLLHETFLYREKIYFKKKKIKKIQKYSVFVLIRAPAAILPAEYENCMQNSAGWQLQYRWENLN
jgi:hypothetical protein